jgi:hypothetical protein
MNHINTSLAGTGLLLALALSLACASLPPPVREASDLSDIGVDVSISAPLWGHTQAEYAYFVRLDESETYAYDDLIRSNYTIGDYVYLFNAEPGRYAVIAAGYQRQNQSAPMGSSTSLGGGFSMSTSVSVTSNNSFIAYLPKTLIDKTAVAVGPAEVAFIGEIVLDKTDWEAADDIQLHYYNLLAPGHKDMNFLMKAFSGQRHDAGTEDELDQGQPTQRRFLEHSQREFADADWESIFRNPVSSGPPPR